MEDVEVGLEIESGSGSEAGSGDTGPAEGSPSDTPSVREDALASAKGKGDQHVPLDRLKAEIAKRKAVEEKLDKFLENFNKTNEMNAAALKQQEIEAYNRSRQRQQPQQPYLQTPHQPGRKQYPDEIQAIMDNPQYGGWAKLQEKMAKYMLDETVTPVSKEIEQIRNEFNEYRRQIELKEMTENHTREFMKIQNDVVKELGDLPEGLTEAHKSQLLGMAWNQIIAVYENPQFMMMPPHMQMAEIRAVFRNAYASTKDMWSKVLRAPDPKAKLAAAAAAQSGGNTMGQGVNPEQNVMLEKYREKKKNGTVSQAEVDALLREAVRQFPE